MKPSELATPSRPLLIENGFVQLKPHSFVRLCNGVFQHVTFQAQGHDLYIWHNALPVALPDINANAGWKSATGRAPAEKELLKAPAADLFALMETVTLPRLDCLADLGSLAEQFSESNIFAYYPRAFCYFQIGRYEDGRAALRRFLADPVDRLEKRLAERYIGADESLIDEMLYCESSRNLKKHKLSRGSG